MEYVQKQPYRCPPLKLRVATRGVAFHYRSLRPPSLSPSPPSLSLCLPLGVISKLWGHSLDTMHQMRRSFQRFHSRDDQVAIDMPSHQFGSSLYFIRNNPEARNFDSWPGPPGRRDFWASWREVHFITSVPLLPASDSSNEHMCWVLLYRACIVIKIYHSTFINSFIH